MAFLNKRMRSDSEIIARSCGEPELFAQLYDRHSSAIAAFILRRAGENEAGTLLSEVFLTAFRVRKSYDLTKASAIGWLYGIARNVLRHHYRSSERHNRITDKAQQYLGRFLSTSFEESTAEAMEIEASLVSVIEMIEAQPEIDQEVVKLYAWEELSYQEIAEVLQIPIGTVRSRLNRLRKNLRELKTDERQEGCESSNNVFSGGSMNGRNQ